MIQELDQDLTHISKLETENFHFVGFWDASAFCMDGMWFCCNQGIPPSIWYVEFLASITAQVVLDKNPTGVLTNSDFGNGWSHSAVPSSGTHCTGHPSCTSGHWI
jgi:hypothetical protein